MAPAKKSFLSGADVANLIEIAASRGVAELSFGDLRVNFSASRAAAPGQTKPAELEQIIREQSEEERKSLASDDISRREDEIAELLLTNPLEAEELMEQELLGESDGSDADGADDGASGAEG